MKSLFAISLFAFLLPLSAAKATTLPEYLVFARHDMSGSRSDFQGATFAGGSIRLEDFLIAGNLRSAATLYFNRGTTRGLIEAPEIKLSQVASRGAKRSNLNGISRILGLELDKLSLKLSALPATAKAQITSPGTMLLQGNRQVEVIDVSSDELSKVHSLFISAAPAASLLIRVRGSEVSLVGKGIFATGSTLPSQVVFFFPDAERLSISRSGGPVFGVPGSIVAPCATFTFSAALVTGEVYVSRLLGANQSNIPTGQVNLSHSPLLRALLEDTCAHDCDQGK